MACHDPMEGGDGVMLASLWANLVKGKKAITPDTAERYRKHVGMMEKATGFALHDALTKDAAAAIKGLRKKYDNAGTMAIISHTILSLYSHTPSFASKHHESHDRWRTFAAAAAAMYRKGRDNNVVTDEIRAKTPTCAEIRKAMAALKISSLRDSQHYLMLALSVDNPPKRRDFGALQVLRRDLKATEGNYIVVPNGTGAVKLVLQEYKTAKKYGRFEELLADTLSDAIKKSLAAYPRKFLFVSPSGGSLSDGAYSEFVRTVFKERLGKPAGVNALRHMYISEQLKNGNLTTEKKRELAKSMNHSLTLQMEYDVVDLVK